MIRRIPAPRFLSKLLLSVVLAWSTVSVTIPAPPVSAETFSYMAYPKGNIGLSKPEIGFEVHNAASFHIGGLSMKIDGQQVPGVFDPQNRKITYTPPAKLAVGTHTVKVTLDFSGYMPVDEEWTFTVDEGAVETVPTTYNADQQAALQAVNDYRLLSGLPALTANPSLMLAAQQHAEYLRRNQAAQGTASLHDQEQGKPNFTGESPYERAIYAGYSGGVGEDVSFHSGTMVESIDTLFDAPYHRTPFLMPQAVEFGAAMAGDYVVLEFGMDPAEEPQLVVSPAPGDPYVPLSFDGHEVPDPLRMHTDTEYPVGYPLMAVVYGDNISEVKLVDASLKDAAGNSVKLLRNSGQNDDHMEDGAILLPEEPLQPDMLYSASVKLTVVKNGTELPMEKSWSFRTEPADGLGKQKLHSDAAAYLKQAQQYAAGSPLLSHTVTFGLDESFYTLDGVKFPMKRTPYVLDGSSYLWVRDLAAALGASVTWDESRRAAVYTKNGRTVTFFTDRPAYEMNGKEYPTGSPARLVDELTLIPVRLLSDVLGAQVGYSDVMRVVNIKY